MPAPCSESSPTEIVRHHRAALRACRVAARRRRDLQQAVAPLTEMGRGDEIAAALTVAEADYEWAIRERDTAHLALTESLLARAACPAATVIERRAAALAEADAWLAQFTDT